MENPIIEITTMTYGGDGLGRLPDGRAVFVPFVLPGERVALRIADDKQRFLRAELLEVLKAAPQRISPRCPHYKDCGGCHYQHTSYEHQLQIKREVLSDQLTRIGKIPNPPVREVVASPNAWNYRNAVQFHLSHTGKLGYQAMESHRLVEIRECHLPELLLDETWRQLDFEAGTGIQRVELRAGVEEDMLLLLEGADVSAPELTAEQRLSIVYVGAGGQQVLAGDDYLLMEVAGESFQVSAQSFFQVNTLQAGAMVRHVLDRLELKSGSTILDVYSGVGLFSKFLARRGAQVIAVELNPWACEDFAVNLDEFDNVALYVGAAEDVLPGLTVPVSAALVDPPRAGMERAALEALCALSPGKIAYVSCDPSTLARDARRLIEAGYRLEETTPFDLFPQTYHIESISLFAR
jgi:23S rRNA (uracil1939-C5)-methyltransferase